MELTQEHFSDKNVGTGKTVTITSSYSGADVSNYSVTDQSSTTANITAKSLTVSGITASDKTYDGSVTATMDGTSAVYSGLVLEIHLQAVILEYLLIKMLELVRQ